MEEKLDAAEKALSIEFGKFQRTESIRSSGAYLMDSALSHLAGLHDQTPTTAPVVNNVQAGGFTPKN